MRNSLALYIPLMFSPGRFRKLGSPAPLPMNTASNPSSKSS